MPRSISRAARVVTIAMGVLSASSALAHPIEPPRSSPAAAATYQIDATLDRPSRTVAGRLTLEWRNEADPVSDICFRVDNASGDDTLLLQSLTWRDGAASVDLMKDSREVTASKTGDAGRFLAVPLRRVIARHEAVVMELTWKTPLHRQNVDGSVLLAGWFPRMTSRGPACAVLEAGTQALGDEANFDVRLTVPKNWPVGATGRRQSMAENADGTITHAFVQRGVRDFSIAAGPAYVETLVPLSLESNPKSSIELHLLLQRDHQAHAGRIADAAREALDQYSQWLTPYPDDHFTIVDVPWQSSAGGQSYPRLITIEARWLQPLRSLTLEAQVARGTSRQWWGGLVRMPDEFLADGLAEYLQSKTAERIFDRRHQALAYSLYEVRELGGFVPWAIRALRLDRETTGLDRSAFRRQPTVPMNDEAGTRRARTAKSATALATLDRYLGWPVMQRGLSLAVRRFGGHEMTVQEFFATMGDAANRNLSWFADQAFGSTAAFDFAVASLSSDPADAGNCGAGRCFQTTVVVQRVGDALFTGTSQPPVGEFESGRAIEIKVLFSDGQEVIERWDGRARSKTFVYVGPSRAVSAQIDPNRTLLLDLNRLNDGRTLQPAPFSVTLPWSVRWTVWLQDLLLTYAFFI